MSVDFIINMGVQASCDRSDALQEVLELLDKANLHEMDDESDDKVYSRISTARLELFQIATAWRRRKDGTCIVNL